jgi:transposase-like protein
MEQQEVRALVRANRPKSAESYSDEVKRAVVAYAQTRRSQGLRWEDLSAETGLSSTTLLAWCKQKSRFLPVTITEEEQPSRPGAVPPRCLHRASCCTRLLASASKD